MTSSFPLDEYSDALQGAFGDKRRGQRIGELLRAMGEHLTVSIRQLSFSRAQQKAFYGVLDQAKVTQNALIKLITGRCSQSVAGRELLVISDTSEINLQKHRWRLQEDAETLGVVGNNRDLGFFVHPSLVLDASRGHVLGFSDLHLWARSEGKGDKHSREYSKLPIEEKESFRWIEGCQKSQKVLQEADHILFIQDREGDIYEQLVRVPDERSDLLVRSRIDRRLFCPASSVLSEESLDSPATSLHARLAQMSVAGSFDLAIRCDKRIGRIERTATVEVRYAPVRLQKPARLKSRTNAALPAWVEVYAIEAREVGGPSENPILWRLLSTRRIGSYEEAYAAIGHYKRRWNIEELFRVLKSKGLNIEQTQLEQGASIQKLTILALETALRVLQMRLAQDNAQSQPLSDVYDAEKQQFLEVLNEQLEGKTEAQKNHNPPDRLSWAVWVIARLGGWGGFASKTKPGVITLTKGLEKFARLYQGYQLAKTGILL